METRAVAVRAVTTMVTNWRAPARRAQGAHAVEELMLAWFPIRSSHSGVMVKASGGREMAVHQRPAVVDEAGVIAETRARRGQICGMKTQPSTAAAPMRRIGEDAAARPREEEASAPSTERRRRSWCGERQMHGETQRR